MNLRGRVSIYINHKNDDLDLIDENKNQDNSITSEESFHETKSVRDSLGNYVTTLGKCELNGN